MTRGKPFICWLGRYNETPLYVGDEVEYQPPNSEKWIKGKVGCKMSGAYVVRVGSKEYPLFMMTQVRKILRGKDAGE